MFAVIKTGGKQYKVNAGDVLLIEKLSAHEGDKIRFNQVLAIGDKTPTIGTPVVKGACVEAEVLSQTKGKKLINFVKRRRKHSSQRKKGHRQNLTLVKVLDIKSDQKLPDNDVTGFEVIGKSKSSEQLNKSPKTESATSGVDKKTEDTSVKKKNLQNKSTTKKVIKPTEDNNLNKKKVQTSATNEKKSTNAKKTTNVKKSTNKVKTKS